MQRTKQNQKPATRSSRSLPGLAVALFAVLPGVACLETGPTTAVQVCESLEELADELGSNRLWDNGVFRRAGSLGRVASRYEESAAIMAEGELLEEISDSDQTSGAALDNATNSISALCGQSSLSGYSARKTLGLD